MKWNTMFAILHLFLSSRYNTSTYDIRFKMVKRMYSNTICLTLITLTVVINNSYRSLFKYVVYMRF